MISCVPIPFHFSGRSDEVGAGRGRARDERLHAFEVLGLRAGGAELDAGDAETIGHGRRIALSRGPDTRRDPHRGAHDRARRRFSEAASPEQLGDAVSARARATTSSPCARSGPRRSSGSGASARWPRSTSRSTWSTCSAARSSAPTWRAKRSRRARERSGSSSGSSRRRRKAIADGRRPRLRRERVHGDRARATRLLRLEGPPQRPSSPVGVPGFEPGTSPTRTARATRLRYTPNPP